jgi:DNA-binding transcriptional MocR family regulator
VRPNGKRPGFTMVPTMLLRASSAPLSTRLVEMAIRSRVDHDLGYAFPSFDQIAADVGVSRRTVMRSIKELERRDLLRVRGHCSERGIQSSNRYWVPLWNKSAKGWLWPKSAPKEPTYGRRNE